MNIHPKTIEEHREYLFSMVRLKLFFTARWLKEHPEEEFRFVLRERVDIIRKTDINPEAQTPKGTYFHLPAWLELENRLEEIFKMVDGNEKLFEEWGFDLCRPHVEKRCERDFNDASVLAAYQCGFLRHNLDLNPDGKTLGFHISNDLRPRSFMDDMNHVKECFTKLLDIAENDFHADKIYTGTWLNSVDRWLELFPQEWKENLSEINTDVRWHYGFWGQFINAKGGFNAKTGEILRKTGKLPYYPRSSFCRISEMRKHLAAL